jgi:hypothetical protein
VFQCTAFWGTQKTTSLLIRLESVKKPLKQIPSAEFIQSVEARMGRFAFESLLVLRLRSYEQKGLSEQAEHKNESKIDLGWRISSLIKSNLKQTTKHNDQRKHKKHDDPRQQNGTSCRQ